MILDILFESDNDIKQTALELLISFKSNGVVRIPYQKFVEDLARNSDLDVDLDIDHLMNTISSLSIVNKVDSVNDVIELKTPNVQYKASKDEEKKDYDKMKQIATAKAKRNIEG